MTSATDSAARGLRILLIDDNEDDRALEARELQRAFADVQTRAVGTADELQRALDAGDFDVVITDYQLRWSTGLEVLRAVKARYPGRPVIMFTGTGNEEVAVEAMKAALDDYVLKKPKYYVRLPLAVRSAVERVRARHTALEALEARERFLTAAAHELRTPLTAVSTALQLLRRRVGALASDHDTGPAAGGDAEEIRRAVTALTPLIERAVRQSRQLGRFITDLQDVARLRGDRFELRIAPVDLREVVRRAVEVQRDLWPRREIALYEPEHPIMVRADADRSEQAVANYLSNALKYTSPPASVRVRVAAEHGWGRVEVTDDGPGLSPEERERIWEPYFQVPQRTHSSGSSIGLGLGLYAVRMIVTQHGGAVGVTSDAAGGSTFWLTLPLATSDETAETADSGAEARLTP